jgi:HEAT repeat protein
MLALLLASALSSLSPLSLPSAGGISTEPAAPAQQKAEKFEDLKLTFERAAVGTDAEARRVALAALAATGQPAVVQAIHAELGRVTEIVDEQSAAAQRSRALIERKQILMEQWKLRATHDESAAAMLERETKAVAELQKEVEKLDRRLAIEEPWQRALTEAAGGVLTALGADKRKKVEGELVTDAGVHPSLPVRRAAIDLLGAVGSLESGLALSRLAQGYGETCDKVEERLPKMMADVRKMEARLAKEASSQNERFSQASYDQYDAVKRDAAELRRKATETAGLVDRAARAAAQAISRGAGKELEEVGPALLRSWKKSKGHGRRAVEAVLSASRVEAVRGLLRAQLATEAEPLARAAWIDALALQGDQACIPDLLERQLVDASWLVRSRAAAALAKLRSREAIPVLIARLSLEEGRTRTDVNTALASLTGQNFRGNVELWQRWWRDNEAKFQVEREVPERTALEEAKDAVGVSFFGITTESQRVLFVIDCSLSMNFSMTPKNNPTDEPGKPFDEPDESKGEFSRLTAAKRDLEKALGGIKDGGLFNIVCYAADVWSWADQPETMSPESRKEALDYIKALTGAAGTNIYSSLEKAFDMAGAKGGSTWVKPAFDTIFFLSDGRATIGLSTNSEEILAFVRERNANAGIVLHTIGLSGAQDAELLRRLAQENGGQYVAR